MKKIKIFICTYKRTDVLNELLENIYSSDFKDIKNTEVNIINNQSIIVQYHGKAWRNLVESFSELLAGTDDMVQHNSITDDSNIHIR